jgi:hypothetical protein
LLVASGTRPLAYRPPLAARDRAPPRSVPATGGRSSAGRVTAVREVLEVPSDPTRIVATWARFR